MRILSLLLFLFLMQAACVTRTQGHLGYLVPGGELKGNMTQQKTCGSLLAWTFLLDENMIDKSLDRAETAKLGPGNREIRMDLNLPSSCYIIRSYEEGK